MLTEKQINPADMHGQNRRMLSFGRLNLPFPAIITLMREKNNEKNANRTTNA